MLNRILFALIPLLSTHIHAMEQLSFHPSIGTKAEVLESAINGIEPIYFKPLMDSLSKKIKNSFLTIAPELDLRKKSAWLLTMRAIISTSFMAARNASSEAAAKSGGFAAFQKAQEAAQNSDLKEIFYAAQKVIDIARIANFKETEVKKENSFDKATKETRLLYEIFEKNCNSNFDETCNAAFEAAGHEIYYAPFYAALETSKAATNICKGKVSYVVCEWVNLNYIIDHFELIFDKTFNTALKALRDDLKHDDHENYFYKLNSHERRHLNSWLMHIQPTEFVIDDVFCCAMHTIETGL